jgi:hypothetical protein
VANKGPTFLKVYVVPVLLLNVILAAWDLVAVNLAYRLPIYLGHAVIVTVSLYLYLMYLGRYLHLPTKHPDERNDESASNLECR